MFELGPVRNIPSGNLVRLLGLARPSGASTSMGFFSEERIDRLSGERSVIKWLAKTDMPGEWDEVDSGDGAPPSQVSLGCELLRTASGWRLMRLKPIAAQHKLILQAVLREICANDIYKVFGCYGQCLAISRQPWMLRDESEQEDVQHLSHPVHLLTEWIHEIQTFGEALIKTLFENHKADDYLAHHCLQHHIPLPVEGLGRILAVAWWLGDIDCLGNKGGNIGYTVKRNDQNTPIALKAIKLDPGYALLDEIDGEVPPFQQDKINIGTSIDTLKISYLPKNVKTELYSTLEEIVALSAADCERFFKRRGLESLFDAAEIAKKKTFLLDRQKQIKRLLPRLAIVRRILPALPKELTPESAMIHIKKQYGRRATLRDPITGKEFQLETHYVNLLLLEGNHSLDSQHFHDREQLNRTLFLRGTEYMQRQKNVISLNEIFSHCLGSTRRVNMPGGAGVGKSTLCQHLLSEWVHGNLLQEYMLVIWVPLRHLNAHRYPSGNQYDLLKVIAKEACGVTGSAKQCRAIANIFRPMQTLWVLDGYDEALGRIPPHLKSLLDKLLAQPHRILTSRPQAIKTVPGDVTIEIGGFSDDNIIEYVEKFDSSSPDLLSRFQQRPALWQLAHVPINCVLLCHVLSEFAVASTSLTGVYEKVEHLLWRRYCQRLGADLSNLPMSAPLPEHLQDRQVKPMANLIGEIALVAMRKGIILIPGETINDLLAKRGIGTAEKQKKYLLVLEKSGMFCVSNDESNEHLPDFYFLHLTLQEYFAAKAVTTGLNISQPATKDWIMREKYTQGYQLMWQFVSGLLVNNPRRFMTFMSYLQQNTAADFIGNIYLRLLITCVHEVYDPADRSYTKKVARQAAQCLKERVLAFYTLYKAGLLPSLFRSDFIDLLKSNIAFLNDMQFSEAALAAEAGPQWQEFLRDHSNIATFEGQQYRNKSPVPFYEKEKSGGSEGRDFYQQSLDYGFRGQAEQAHKCMLRAAEQGYPYAYVNLVLKGRGILLTDDMHNKDKKMEEEYLAKIKPEHLTWFESQSDKGHPEAQLMLGKMLYHGVCFAINKELALALFRNSAQFNYARALLTLGYLYKSKIATAEKKKEGVVLYRRAAIQGYEPAIYNLGVSYLMGDGVKKNVTKALEWFDRAAKLGSPRAFYALGRLYLKDEGLRDSTRAMYWVRKAIDAGNLSARKLLADCYQQGWGVEKDEAYAEQIKVRYQISGLFDLPQVLLLDNAMSLRQRIAELATVIDSDHAGQQKTAIDALVDLGDRAATPIVVLSLIGLIRRRGVNSYRARAAIDFFGARSISPDSIVGVLKEINQDLLELIQHWVERYFKVLFSYKDREMQVWPLLLMGAFFSPSVCFGIIHDRAKKQFYLKGYSGTNTFFYPVHRAETRMLAELAPKFISCLSQADFDGVSLFKRPRLSSSRPIVDLGGNRLIRYSSAV